MSFTSINHRLISKISLGLIPISLAILIPQVANYYDCLGHPDPLVPTEYLTCKIQDLAGGMYASLLMVTPSLLLLFFIAKKVKRILDYSQIIIAAAIGLLIGSNQLMQSDDYSYKIAILSLAISIVFCLVSAAVYAFRKIKS